MADSKRFPHLKVERLPRARLYKSPVAPPSTRTVKSQDRATHADALLRQFDRIEADVATRRLALAERDLPIASGTYVEFISQPGETLALASLDRQGSGIALTAYRQEEKESKKRGAKSELIEHATVFVPDGQMSQFRKLVEDYRTKETRPDKQGKTKPRHQNLVDPIADVRRAVLRSFWTDSPDSFPTGVGPHWWELWLRGAEEEVEARFRVAAAQLGLAVSRTALRFGDRTVVLIRATARQLTDAADVLDILAELRRARDLASDFSELEAPEQSEWSQALVDQTVIAAADAPRVTLLDTGTNRGHPLLKKSLSAKDTQAYDKSWGAADDHPRGHGTGMAGLALWGDLVDVIGTKSTVVLEHRLESVKLLPPAGQRHLREVYGAVTRECIGIAEVQAPEQKRVVCLAVTTDEHRDRGQPSSWSAEIDQLSGAFGESEDAPRRLIFISSGNSDVESVVNYPDSLVTQEVLDPGQSWNGVTVGAATQKVTVKDPTLKGYSPLAPAGGLSAHTRTSQLWRRQWPNKPDVLFEGGNHVVDKGGVPLTAEDVQLLTTDARFATGSLLTTFDQTSAATALAARFGAQLLARYPDYWPETIRALMVHSADWSPAQLAPFGQLSTETQKVNLLRSCGYGAPNLTRALWSAQNALTLVMEDELRPFSGGKMNEYKLYDLPWPKDELAKIEDEVTLRVTLSYFIEPNPGRRGDHRLGVQRDRYRYASHQLRFKLQDENETTEKFRERISLSERDDQEKKGGNAQDRDGWVLGSVRDRGSIHSDRWKGPAALLARKRQLAVFPVTGWWKASDDSGRPRVARYSLIVSVESPSVDVDIYTPVAIELGVPVVVET